jgi:Domain of unknown function (DUF4272)
MADPATLYLPMPWPGAALVRAFAPEGTAVSEEGGAIWMRWRNASIRLHPMAAAEVPGHLQGMFTFLRDHGAHPAAVVRARHSQSVLGLVAEPRLDHPAVWEAVLRIHSLSDALLFVNGDFYTRDGVTLLGSGLPAPAADRVARRALVLLALATRGLLDEDAGKPDEAKADALRERIWAWVGERGVREEAEPDEAELLQTPLGRADRQAIIDAVWRAEGAQVLLWALGARALPAHDAQEHPYDVARDAGLRAEGEVAILAKPTLRSPAEIEARRAQLEGIDWRLVQQRVKPGPVDLAAFAARAPFGAFSLDGVPLVGGDLALRGAAIHAAPGEILGLSASIARERHAAANWLIGVNPVYSQVSTPT